MSEFEILDDVLAHLETLLAALEPKVFDATGAARLVERFTRGERLCAAGKGLAARRVEECGTWKREGFRSSAHWLADQSGVTVGAAEQALRTARALDELPATEAAFRAGELSEVQAAEISGAALGDPGSEAALLDAAGSSSVNALRGECRQVRAASVTDDQEWARAQHAARRLDRWTDDLGMRRGDWKLPPAMAAALDVAIDDEIDRLWRAADRDGRRTPRAVFAADALVNLVTHGPRKAPEVKLTVDFSALERGHTEGAEKCEIAGIGPVPVTVARALIQDSG